MIYICKSASRTTRAARRDVNDIMVSRNYNQVLRGNEPYVFNLPFTVKLYLGLFSLKKSYVVTVALVPDQHHWEIRLGR